MRKKIWSSIVSVWQFFFKKSVPQPVIEATSPTEKAPYSTEDLDAYEQVLLKAAKEGSDEVFANRDIRHAVIVICVIFATARSQVIMTPNEQSHEVLGHPRCIRAMKEAQARNVQIVVLPGYKPFFAWNDIGMMRHELNRIDHRAYVYFS